MPGTKEDPKCCTRDKGFSECFPIEVSHKDPFYSLFNQKCITVTRSAPGVEYGCKLGIDHPFSFFMSYILILINISWSRNNNKIYNRFMHNISHYLYIIYFLQVQEHRQMRLLHILMLIGCMEVMKKLWTDLDYIEEVCSR